MAPAAAAAIQPSTQITWVQPMSAPRRSCGANSPTRLVATGATPPNPTPATKSTAPSAPSDGASDAAPVDRALNPTVSPYPARRPIQSAAYPMTAPPTSWPAPAAAVSSPASPGVRPQADCSPGNAKLSTPRFRPLLANAKPASSVTRRGNEAAAASAETMGAAIASGAPAVTSSRDTPDGAPRTVSRGGAERVEPCDVAPDDQRVDVVGPLVRIHRLEVGGVTHRMVLERNAVAAENGPRLPGDDQSGAHVVALGEADLCVSQPARVLQPAEMIRQQLGFGDFREHVYQPLLDQLRGRDRPAKGHAIAGVRERLFVACDRRPDRAPGDPVARLREAPQRGPEADGFGKHGVPGHLDMVEDQLAGDGGAHGRLGVDVVHGKPRELGIHEEAADLVLLVLGPHDGHVGERAVRDPHLRPGQHPPGAASPRPRLHRRGIAAGRGLGQPEAADLGSGGHRRQPPAALFLRPVLVDRVHDEGALDGRKRPHPAVAALELLHDEPVGHVVHAGAPVLGGKVGPVRPEIAERGDEIARKLAGEPRPADAGDHLPVDEPGDGVAREAFILAEQAFDSEVVHALGDRRHRTLLKTLRVASSATQAGPVTTDPERGALPHARCACARPACAPLLCPRREPGRPRAQSPVPRPIAAQPCAAESAALGQYAMQSPVPRPIAAQP